MIFLLSQGCRQIRVGLVLFGHVLLRGFAIERFGNGIELILGGLGVIIGGLRCRRGIRGLLLRRTKLRIEIVDFRISCGQLGIAVGLGLGAGGGILLGLGGRFLGGSLGLLRVGQSGFGVIVLENQGHSCCHGNDCAR